MDTLELECPSCTEMLEIDAGFAGGVCRCSNCGTLMTVPEDPTRQRAERLTRPDRPDAPGSPASPAVAPAPSPRRPEAPPTRETPRETPAQPAAAAPTPPPALTPAPAPAAAPAPTAPGEEVYTTASGKTIRVRKASIPMARKRKRAIIRASVVLIFAIVTVLLVGVTIVAVIMLGTEPTAVPGGGKPTDRGTGWVAANNPFQVSVGHFLGLTLDYDAVIAIDAGAGSGPWFDEVKDALRRGLAHAGPEVKLQVVFWSSEGFKAIPEGGPVALSEAAREELLKAVEEVRASGATKPDAAVAKALESFPSQLILVTSQTLEPERIEALTDLLRAQPVTELDIVQLDREQDALASLARRYNGKYISLPASQLRAWLDASAR